MKTFLRILTGSLVGCLSMLYIFYLWHGVVLNDINSLQYDFTIYLGLLFILYFFISICLSFVFSTYNPEKNKTFKHITIGVFFGFLIYLIAFVLGVSFNQGGLEHILLDFTWQMCEQGIGALIISIYYTVVYRFERMEKMKSFN